MQEKHWVDYNDWRLKFVMDEDIRCMRKYGKTLARSGMSTLHEDVRSDGVGYDFVDPVDEVESKKKKRGKPCKVVPLPGRFLKITY